MSKHTVVFAVVVGSVLAAVPAVEGVTRESDLVGWWKMGEGAAWDGGASEWTVPDDSAYDGTATSSGLLETDVVAGYPFESHPGPSLAVQYNDNGEYLQAAVQAAQTQSTSFTISAWGKVTQWVSGDYMYTVIDGFPNYLLSMAEAGMAEYEGTPLEDHRVHAFVGGWATGYFSEPYRSVSPDQWYHMVLLYDEPEAYLYKDGEQVAHKTIPEELRPLAPSENPIQIGHRPHGTSKFSGLIDDVRIYGEALSVEDIAAIYNDGKGDFLVGAAPGDLSGDGDVDLEDVGLFELQFGSQAPGDYSADFDEDGDVDLDDLAVMRGNWRYGAGGGPPGNAATPEPATLILMAAGLPVLLRLRRVYLLCE